MTPAEVDSLLFSMGERQRFTQDTPILPEVWYAYAAEPQARHDLLVTPLDTVSANRLLREIVSSAEEDGDGAVLQGAVPAALRGFVALRLDFRQFCQTVLPRTKWATEARELGRSQDFEGGWLLRYLDLFRSQRRYRDDRGRGQFETARIAMLVGAILDEDYRYRLLQQGRRSRFSQRRAAEHVEIWLRGQRTDAFIDRLSDRPSSGIWRVALNRPLDLSDTQARSTVKADAASRLFEVDCSEITWAVVDSGIDVDHAAFNDGGVRRVVASYDLTSLRSLLDATYRSNPAGNPQLAASCAASGVQLEEGVRLLSAIHRSLETDSLDWASIERLISLASPPPPADGHGTHVAGIIGANWRDDGDPVVVGMCPDIRLMDLRILVSETGDAEKALKESEFAIISALQFIRYLNGRNEHIQVHGVNLSISIPHMVENYACGRTPVCDECERLVGAGVTVVAAAGNNGYHGFSTSKGVFKGYATLSITDPGNAESVITVGSTHKREPHTYGVSYFSSRGPTGDGRQKPDLVAPGERIRSTLPGDDYGPLDGTSQAAPHVSGAAAVLMSRFPELRGQPRQVKRLICDSATDLGRERAFQGHGLLDVLRALQSY